MPLTRHPSWEPRLILVRYELYMETPVGKLFMIFVNDDVPRKLEPEAKDGMDVISKYRNTLEKIGSDMFDRGEIEPDGLSVLITAAELGDLKAIATHGSPVAEGA